MITQVLGLSATLLAAVFLFPQIASLIWERDTRGVSMTWAIFGVVTNAAWVAYLLQEGLWLPSFAPATAVVTYGLLAVVLAQLGARHRWAWGLGYSAALALVGLLGGRQRSAPCSWSRRPFNWLRRSQPSTGTRIPGGSLRPRGVSGRRRQCAGEGMASWSAISPSSATGWSPRQARPSSSLVGGPPGRHVRCRDRDLPRRPDLP